MAALKSSQGYWNKGLTLKLIAGPPSTTRITGRQQMTSDWVYALTPLPSMRCGCHR
jgi:hypothetical protein